MRLDRTGLGYDHRNEWLRSQYVRNTIYKNMDITKDYDGGVLKKVTVSPEVKSSRNKVIYPGFGG